MFWLDGLILPLCPLRLVACSLQAQLPLLAFSLLCLLQMGQSRQSYCQLIWSEHFEETLLNLCIQSHRSHFLAALASKLALVVVADIDGELTMWTRVAQMQKGAAIAAAHDPLK